MLYNLKLKNSEETVLVDQQVYDYILKDEYLSSIKLIDNLRKHSSGCCVFQKTWKNPDGGFRTETLYLHKLIAEYFLSDKRTNVNRLAGTKNGNKLDCRLENVHWRSRSTASRQRKSSSETGYTGVYKENHRYRAVISINRKSVHLGMYDTPEEAAEAYNQKSKELYGTEGKQNILKNS